ncbi:hypothetical protein PsAD2_00021 [Pseudovibrio axinellae]|uniref:Uncharacterized protein n=1 Tax=Pseudovibrio axinellae TaxID=989403 RepID=A0A161XGV6_9HYPH|nr:hypothetical protein [Pseudovibrio axinellae]KZL21996.1 hypothetical protein PsAD2_00021 [Pseudovibrio axinellae]SEQ59401.1 pilus assembly protein Flp/PilA [Pseudovibrio axinellae]
MLSLLSGLLQRELGSATIEFGLLSGLIALAIMAMASTPTLTETAFIPGSATQQQHETEADLELWELVKPNI